ncbi:MAG: NAD(P)-dependent oxidoreductase [Acidobacteriota bacterium]
MRVFVAGGSGVMGRVLVPMLVARGHEVTATTRRAEQAKSLRAMGATPEVVDVYDVEALAAAVGRSRPDVLVHQLTALPQAIDLRRLERDMAANDRIRVEGTRNLVEAAKRAGVGRVVAQSIAFTYAPQGDWVKDETAPLWLDAPWPWRRSVAASAELERQVLETDGVVLRYGYFYGPGTAYDHDGSMTAMVRAKQLPILGRGKGMTSFIHIDDAARATVLAVESERTGVFNIVDDEPSRQDEWLPAFARSLGAPAPSRVPSLLGRLVLGRTVFAMIARQRGASNARAKRELGWAPMIASWRTGFEVGDLELASLAEAAHA